MRLAIFSLLLTGIGSTTTPSGEVNNDNNLRRSTLATTTTSSSAAKSETRSTEVDWCDDSIPMYCKRLCTYNSPNNNPTCSPATDPAGENFAVKLCANRTSMCSCDYDCVEVGGNSEPEQCSECSGLAMRAANYFCADGSLAGPVCLPPSCEWTMRSCPSTTAGNNVQTTTAAIPKQVTKKVTAKQTNGVDWCEDSLPQYCRMMCLYDAPNNMPTCEASESGAQLCANRTSTCSCKYDCVVPTPKCSEIQCQNWTCTDYRGLMAIDKVRSYPKGCEACNTCM